MTSTLILSPHCDDAPLSLGAALVTGLLGAQTRVTIVFSQSRFTKLQPGNGKTVEVTALRAAEEKAAAEEAGYSVTFLEFGEPAVRNHARGREDIFNLADEVEKDRVWRPVCLSLEELMLRHAGLVLAPLGCGGHIDHRLVRVAAQLLAKAHPTLRLGFYEDLPYVDEMSDAEIEALLPKNTHRPVLVSSGLHEKLQLLTHYASQPDHSVQVRRYWLRRGGERLWLPTSREHS